MSASSDGWPAAVAAPSMPPGSPSFPPGPMSTVPVVQDLGDLDLDVGSYKRGKRTKLIGAVLGVAAVLGGGAFALTRLDQPPTAAIEEPKVQAAAHPPAPAYTPPAPTPAPAPEPTPAPAAANPEPEKKDDSASSGRLSEDVKAALLANDKTKKSAKSAKATKASKASRSRPATRRGGGSSTGFKSGGNANDPLNGNL